MSLILLIQNNIQLLKNIIKGLLAHENILLVRLRDFWH